MIDLSKMSATELQQMLTNIYTIASAYTDNDPEQCTKLERITIMFDDDHIEKLNLLYEDPEEYFKHKYSQEPTYSDEEILSLVQDSNSLSDLQTLLDVVDSDQPKYIPQTFERITKLIYYSIDLMRRLKTSQPNPETSF